MVFGNSGRNGEDMLNQQDIIVLGAGMVGISTALSLQEAGHHVVVVDRKKPGQETSFGNAGIIQMEAAEPYAFPWGRSLWSAMTGKGNHIKWDMEALWQQRQALMQYAKFSLPKNYSTIAACYATLIREAGEDHNHWLSKSTSDHLIQRKGFYNLYQSDAALETDAAYADVLHEKYGVNSKILDGAGIRKEEPILRDTPKGAIWWEDSWTCKDPEALTLAYSNLFLSQGGDVVCIDVQQIKKIKNGWQIEGANTKVSGSHLVICAGPWSPILLEPLGYKIPMIYKYGHHTHVKSLKTLHRPIMDVSQGLVVAPMSRGLRITSGAELVGRHRHPTGQQLKQGAQRLAKSFTIEADDLVIEWSGRRPCHPWMLPFVGPAPHHAGLWFHFGHGHQGFTLGPTTAKILTRAFENIMAVPNLLRPVHWLG